MGHIKLPVYTFKNKKISVETRNVWIAMYKIVADVMRSAAYPSYSPETFVNTKRYNR